MRSRSRSAFWREFWNVLHQMVETQLNIGFSCCVSRRGIGSLVLPRPMGSGYPRDPFPRNRPREPTLMFLHVVGSTKTTGMLSSFPPDTTYRGGGFV